MSTLRDILGVTANLEVWVINTDYLLSMFMTYNSTLHFSGLCWNDSLSNGGENKPAVVKKKKEKENAVNLSFSWGFILIL